jgi:tetratricopeptide (TPR) repeat protein
MFAGKRSDGADRVQPRIMRVFVSSTFRDMQAEREELVKRVFPQLRELCESRGVTWGEVDLRWGITDEQKAEGKVLPICLAEIRECRPFFLGVLGERYGWVPEEIDEALIEREPWLAEHPRRSVTELEIFHGVLWDPSMAEQAFFYFRDPTYAERDPEFCERADALETERIGEAGALDRAERRRARLAALKDEIRASGLPVHENYPDPGSFGQLVLKDLTEVIDRLFPAGSEPSPVEHERELHEAFARSRRGVYIERPEYFQRLDAHAAGTGAPLVVLGESGIGKSALLANWALRLRERDEIAMSHGELPGGLMVMHFVGASPGSADWVGMLRRILAELDGFFELGLEIPDEPAVLGAAFAEGLHRAAARGRVVLVIDALNQLEDRDGAPDLVWLPPVIPENVRLVLTTLPGRPLDELRRRGWPTLKVGSLERHERERLIDSYLAQYTKTLAGEYVQEIASAPESAHPLFLRAMLEELRLYGDHETLRQQIAQLLRAGDAPELYELILARWERDYERDRPGLVRDAMTLLWAARRGLSESELLQMLGREGEPLPHAAWSPLYLAVKETLISRAGLLSFAHDHARTGVARRYIPGEDNKHGAHLRLARHFEHQPQVGARKLEELPWQLARAHAWRQLYDQLADVSFTNALDDAARFELLAYWADIERSSQLSMVQAYQPVLENPTSTDHAGTIANLLRAAGHLDEAAILWWYLVDHRRKSGNRDGVRTALGNLAPMLRDRGDLDAALAMHKEEEQILRADGPITMVAASLSNQALILRERGDEDDALANFREAERILREAERILFKEGAYQELRGKFAAPELDRVLSTAVSQPLAAVLGNQALILLDRGDINAALVLLEEAEQICRRFGDLAALQAVLGNQANALSRQGDTDGALALHKEEERITRELGDHAALADSLGNQAIILQDRGDLDGALALYVERADILRQRGDIKEALFWMEKAEGITRELGDRAALANTLLPTHAAILQEQGDLERALSLFGEQEQIYRELQDPAGLARSLWDQAVVLLASGDLDRALVALKEQEQICRETGDPKGLAASLGNQAQILGRRGDLDKALALVRETDRICRKHDDLDGLQTSLGNHALILRGRGDLDGALALHKEEELICRQLADLKGLAKSLENQASVLAARGDSDAALTLQRERERICREAGDYEGLVMSLDEQALILRNSGDLEGALKLHKDQELLCRARGDLIGLGRSLGSQAIILGERGDLDSAIAMFKDAEATFRELGDPLGLATSLQNQAVILVHCGRADEAIPAAEAARRLLDEYGSAEQAQGAEQLLAAARSRSST